MKPSFSLLLIYWLLVSCTVSSQAPTQPTQPVAAPPSSTPASLPSTSTPATTPTAASSPTLPPTQTATALPSLTPTITLSPTPAIPVYDPDTTGDPRKLDSFVLVSTGKFSGSGQSGGGTGRIEYVKAPFAVHSGNNSAGQPEAETWLFADWVYSVYGKDWTIKPATGGPEDPFYYDLENARKIEYFQSAKFTGQQDYKGTPANHFTFDQTDLESNLGEWKINQAQGEAYLSVDGNYLLYYHWKLTGNIIYVPGKTGWYPGSMEHTQELTAVNQPLHIALPADTPKLKLDLGLQLPPGTTLQGINQYAIGGTLFYTFKTPVSNDDFLKFYQGATPANGWTIEQAGPSNLPTLCFKGCVIFKDGVHHWLMIWQNEITQWVLVLYYYPKDIPMA